MRLCLALVLCSACGSEPGSAPLAGDETPPTCGETSTYPEGAVEPMALGEVLSPYRWPEAIDRRTGDTVSLDLADVPCALDATLGWTQFAALLFVSIPAW